MVSGARSRTGILVAGAIGTSRGSEHEIVCRSLPGDGRHLDIRQLVMVCTNPLHVPTATIEGGQYCLPVALYGQSVVLTLRVETRASQRRCARWSRRHQPLPQGLRPEMELGLHRKCGPYAPSSHDRQRVLVQGTGPGRLTGRLRQYCSGHCQRLGAAALQGLDRAPGRWPAFVP